MEHMATLIVDFAWILIIAGITTLICKKLKQPVIIGYVLAGFLLSPVTDFFPMFVTETGEIETLAEIGVIFLMFSLGLEFNLHKMVQVGVSGTLSATVQIVGMVLLGYLVGMLLGWSATDSLFLGGMLSMSSTIITVKAIEDCNIRDSKFSELAIGTLIIEDIAAIFLMLVLSTVSVSQSDGAGLLLTIGTLLFYLALWLVLGIFLVPTLIQKISRLLTGETLLIVSLGLCFGMVLIADAIGFSSALGAFMAGSLLAGTGIAGKVEELVAPCKDLFVAVFFVSVGFLVVPATLLEYALPILLLIAVTVVGKVVLLSVSYLLTRQDLSTSLHCALSQTQVGEFSFVIASLGLTLGVTSDFLYPVIVAVALLTTFTTPFLLKSAAPLNGFLEKKLPKKLLANIQERSLSREEDNGNDASQKIIWTRYLKRYFINIFIYAIICGGIVVVGNHLLLPFALIYFPYTATKYVVLVVLIAALMPFLPQLMFSRNPDFTALWMGSKFNRFPLSVMMGLRCAIAVGFLMLVPITLFDRIHYYLLLLMIPIAFLAARSKKLRGSYLTIAAKFIANLNEKQLHENSKKQRLLWENDELMVDTYRIPEGSLLIGRTLAQLNWGRFLQINIIRLYRGKKIYNLPSGKVVLQAGDVICLYGREDVLANFRLVFEEDSVVKENSEAVPLRNYIVKQDRIPEKDQLYCYGTLIHKNSPFNNKSIRDSAFRENRNCFIVGVERELLPISVPSPNFILRTGDIVWVLGTVTTIINLLEDDAVIYAPENSKNYTEEAEESMEQ